jgi:hypothetical protein
MDFSKNYLFLINYEYRIYLDFLKMNFNGYFNIIKKYKCFNNQNRLKPGAIPVGG